MKTAVVINAGGTGTRLWPLSRQNKPKQFLNLVGENSLIRDSYLRLIKQYSNEDIYIICNKNFKELVADQIPELSASNILVEPLKMDRLAATGLITLILKEKGYSTIILLPSDDYIGNTDAFLEIFRTVEDVNKSHPDKLLLLGMNPNYPAIGFGYIEMGDPVGRFGKDIVFKVQSFKEKPDQKTAESFIQDWRYLWNASYYIFNPDHMCNVMQRLTPNTYECLEKCYRLDPDSQEFKDYYSKCEKISFDIAITEKLEEVFVVPASLQWEDVGSWKSVRDIIRSKSKDTNGNAISGNALVLDSQNSMIINSNPKKKVAILGLEEIVVIETEDALLVTHIDKVQDVKKIVDNIDEDLK